MVMAATQAGIAAPERLPLPVLSARLAALDRLEDYRTARLAQAILTARLTTALKE